MAPYPASIISQGLTRIPRSPSRIYPARMHRCWPLFSCMTSDIGHSACQCMERLMSTDLYLKPNLLAEPLVCNWYAWTHLIPPVTAGMNVADRHLSIMKSFVQ